MRRSINGWLARRGPEVFIAAHWPWPMRKPYQRRQLRLLAPGGGIGDELMCTPIFAEIKRRNPRCQITFFTRHPEFFKDHPDIDSVESLTRGEWPKALRLAYHYTLPPPRPLMTLMAECVGIIAHFDQVKPPPIVPSESVRASIEQIPRPRIVIQAMSSRWTVNKNWPADCWRRLIEMLVEKLHVIEVGTDSPFDRGMFGPRFHSFVGKTSLSDLAYVMSQADLFIGPSSGGMHFANAYGIKSVIIFGGYESPAGYEYPRTVSFYTSKTEPCWSMEPCPHCAQCLAEIQPAEVYAAVRSLLEKDATR